MSRKYCFTLFEDVEDHYDRLRTTVWGSQDVVRAICFQQEVCPDSGRLHLQGFVRFFRTHRVRGAQLALALPSSTHLESARGTDQSNLEYCTKPESRVPGSTPFQFGSFGAQGVRTDLECVVDAVRGGGFDPLEHLSTAARYPKFIDFVELRLGRPPIRAKTNHYVWGPTGVGKSSWAWERDPDLYPLASCKPEWWDGYFGQRTILIDEFDREQIPIARLNRILDRYPVLVPVKGAFKWLKAEEVIICSNRPLEEIYVEGVDATGDQIAALRRRLDVIHMRGDVNEILHS